MGGGRRRLRGGSRLGGDVSLSGGGGGEGWFRGLTIVGAEDLALLADAGAWFGHGCSDVCDLNKVVMLVGVADR